MAKRIDVFAVIDEERKVQEKKWGDQSKFGTGTWLALLLEELGEASNEYLNANYNLFRYELIQAAAVIVAMLEYGGGKDTRRKKLNR